MLAPKRAAFFKAQGKATRGTSGSRCPGERMRSKIGRAKSAADKRSVIETEINRGSFRSRDSSDECDVDGSTDDRSCLPTQGGTIARDTRTGLPLG